MNQERTLKFHSYSGIDGIGSTERTLKAKVFDGSFYDKSALELSFYIQFKLREKNGRLYFRSAQYYKISPIGNV